MQLEALASNGGAAEFVAHHMLVALKALVPILAQMFSDDRIEAMDRLQDLAWVPTTNSEGRITQLQNQSVCRWCGLLTFRQHSGGCQSSGGGCYSMHPMQ